ncbi:F-box domain [Dillenia turbinata]|uniref:F-box domain n=1 Tax=Dillenia turbinata TaxID=194707 RepID=A0AAN8V005_9MAGN
MAGNAEKYLVNDEGIARNWGDLPRKILVLIAKGLSCSNQLRFCGVCKSWRSIRMIEILTVNGLPCLVRFSCVDEKAMRVDNWISNLPEKMLVAAAVANEVKIFLLCTSTRAFILSSAV